MAQLFHPSSNTIAKASIFGALILVAAAGWMAYEINRSPWNTGVNVALAQPVPFSHEHHVSGLGIDCRYCHTSVADSSFAGLPGTQTCMTCHSQIWTNSEMLEPVRESWRTGVPIAWNRVHDLPDYAHFDHSIHVNRGVSCVSCHGQVNEMPLMAKAHSLQMEWCLDCHRDPTPHLRPPDKVYDMEWHPLVDFKSHEEYQQWQKNRATKLFGFDKLQMTNCSVCHY